MSNLQPVLDFLVHLSGNNNKAWFDAHREQYDSARALFEDLVMDVIMGLSAFEPVGGLTPKDCMYRINRDIRFSKDKTPYKDSMSASFTPGGKHAVRAGYYLHISPGNSFLGGGAWQPSKEQLALIRADIAGGAPELKRVVAAKDFKKTFGELSGEKLKVAPKGYPKDHPEIEWLKLQSLTVGHRLSDEDACKRNLDQRVVKVFAAMKPFLDYINAVCKDAPGAS